jgi:hypothetical protein
MRRSATWAQHPTMGLVGLSDLARRMGGRQILLDDPSGNCIELFEPARR